MNDQISLEENLSAWCANAFIKAFGKETLGGVVLDVQPTSGEGFGDYQCNAAMGLARVLKQKPRDIAQAVKDLLEPSSLVERVDIAGPGFLNIFLHTQELARLVERLGTQDRLGVGLPGKGQTVVLDYSGPNIAKPMHIGHVRSTVIGNALDRLYRFLGYRVVADNHLGDWGTQFGILMVGYRAFRDDEALRTSPVEELERIYVQSYEKARADEAWMDAARAELVKLQQGDAENLALWNEFVQLSMGEFERIYKRLDVSFDLVRGESYYNSQLEATVAALEKKGLAVESDGATIVDLEDEKLPVCMIRKSDGGFNYATSDLATINSRVAEFSPGEIIYVTDERQQLHFKQVFSVARRMGHSTRFTHVWFGLMRLPEGTFSTREGNVIKLEKLLDEAEARALKMVEIASPDMPASQQVDVARAVGIGAIKYADLSQNPQSLVTFTWEKAMALDGNSAPYLQYAYARIASVQDKYRERYPDLDLASHPIALTEPIERKLALRILRFGVAIQHAVTYHRPNILADYLYELAQDYSTFYQTTPFLKAEEGVRESRVRLCALVSRTLRTGLGLLGIETPDRI